MGRSSTKKNKTPYQIAREEMEFTREKASDALESIRPYQIERIESEKAIPSPEDVLNMARVYKKPTLCNYYCSQQCAIGREYVPSVSIKELSAIVLEMLASLNSVEKTKDRLVEIAADGKIDADEIDDFINIQNELERISITVETLQFWAEKMLASDVIDSKEYYKRKAQ